MLTLAYRVFLSHSSRDKRWVEWIQENAKGIGVDVYLAEHDVQAGRQLSEKEAIGQCNALLVLLTDNSQSSTYVHQEIGTAVGLGKLIIPLVQPGVECGAMLQGKE